MNCSITSPSSSLAAHSSQARLLQSEHSVFKQQLVGLARILQGGLESLAGAKIASLDGDKGYTEQLFPRNASMTIVCGVGLSGGACLEILPNPRLSNAPAPSEVGRALASSLFGRWVGQKPLIMGIGSRRLTPIIELLKEGLRDGQYVQDLGRVASRASYLEDVLLILPKDAPFAIASAALSVFPLVVTPRSSFDEDVNDHLHVLISRELFLDAEVRAWKDLHENLSGLVEEVSPVLNNETLSHQEGTVRCHPARGERARKMQRQRPPSQVSREAQSTPPAKSSGERTAVDDRAARMNAARRIANLEDELRARGLIL